LNPALIVPTSTPHEGKQLHESEYNSHESEMVPTTISHVAGHRVISGPWKHSGKIFKSEICWKACEVTLVSLNYLYWIKCICTRAVHFSVYHFCFIYLFYDQIRR